MEQAHWIKRKHASVRMAEKSVCAEARLIHYELAGRYSVKAAAAGSTQPQLDLPQPSEAFSQLQVGTRLPGARS